MPISISDILNKVLFVIFSFKNKQANIGTKTFPKDSKIGISFNFTPLRIAVILISKEQKNIT